MAPRPKFTSTTTESTLDTDSDGSGPVAAAMMGIAKASAQVVESNLKHKRRFCRIEGCNRIVKSQGLCQRHGATPRKCKVEGCDKQAQGNFDRMCKSHFKAMKRATTPLPPPPKDYEAPPPPAGTSVYDYILPASIRFVPTYENPSDDDNKGDGKHQSSRKKNSSKAPQPKEVMPLIAHLKAGFDALKPPAWHRNEERRCRGMFPIHNPATQLEGWERELVWMEILVLTGAPGASFRHLARAWGRDKGFHMVLAQFICERHGDVERKKRQGIEAGATEDSKRKAGKNAKGVAIIPNSASNRKRGATVARSPRNVQRRRVSSLGGRGGGSASSPSNLAGLANGDGANVISADIWDDACYGDADYNEALAADIFNFSEKDFDAVSRKMRAAASAFANEDDDDDEDEKAIRNLHEQERQESQNYASQAAAPEVQDSTHSLKHLSESSHGNGTHYAHSSRPQIPLKQQMLPSGGTRKQSLPSNAHAQIPASNLSYPPSQQPGALTAQKQHQNLIAAQPTAQQPQHQQIAATQQDELHGRHSQSHYAPSPQQQRQTQVGIQAGLNQQLNMPTASTPQQQQHLQLPPQPAHVPVNQVKAQLPLHHQQQQQLQHASQPLPAPITHRTQQYQQNGATLQSSNHATNQHLQQMQLASGPAHPVVNQDSQLPTHDRHCQEIPEVQQIRPVSTDRGTQQQEHAQTVQHPQSVVDHSAAQYTHHPGQQMQMELQVVPRNHDVSQVSPRPHHLAAPSESDLPQHKQKRQIAPQGTPGTVDGSQMPSQQQQQQQHHEQVQLLPSTATVGHEPRREHLQQDGATHETAQFPQYQHVQLAPQPMNADAGLYPHHQTNHGMQQESQATAVHYDMHQQPQQHHHHEQLQTSTQPQRQQTHSVSQSAPQPLNQTAPQYPAQQHRHYVQLPSQPSVATVHNDSSQIPSLQPQQQVHVAQQPAGSSQFPNNHPHQVQASTGNSVDSFFPEQQQHVSVAPSTAAPPVVHNGTQVHQQQVLGAQHPETDAPVNSQNQYHPQQQQAQHGMQLEVGHSETNLPPDHQQHMQMSPQTAAAVLNHPDTHYSPSQQDQQQLVQVFQQPPATDANQRSASTQQQPRQHGQLVQQSGTSASHTPSHQALQMKVPHQTAIHSTNQQQLHMQAGHQTVSPGFASQEQEQDMRAHVDALASQQFTVGPSPQPLLLEPPTLGHDARSQFPMSQGQQYSQLGSDRLGSCDIAGPSQNDDLNVDPYDPQQHVQQPQFALPPQNQPQLTLHRPQEGGSSETAQQHAGSQQSGASPLEPPTLGHDARSQLPMSQGQQYSQLASEQLGSSDIAGPSQNDNLSVNPYDPQQQVQQPQFAPPPQNQPQLTLHQPQDGGSSETAQQHVGLQQSGASHTMQAGETSYTVVPYDSHPQQQQLQFAPQQDQMQTSGRADGAPYVQQATQYAPQHLQQPEDSMGHQQQQPIQTAHPHPGQHHQSAQHPNPDIPEV